MYERTISLHVCLVDLLSDNLAGIVDNRGWVELHGPDDAATNHADL